MSGSSREALPEVLESSGGPPVSPGLVRRPSRKSVSGREAIPEVREWSGSHPGCPGGVGRPS